MTKTVKSAPAKTYFASVTNALDTVQSKLEVPASARDFVKKGAATVSDRAETVHTGAIKFTNGAEKLAQSFVGGYANFARGLVDMTLANVKHTLTTVEKLSGAKSLNEAAKIQVDFVRENASANMERVRGAAETARTVVTEGAKEVQAELSKLYSFNKKAA